MTLLTVACGTINRLDGLQRMVQSVRDTIPNSFGVEFIVSDNGSTDGTAEWIQSQPDMTLIQHGKPVGGIKALTEAGHRANGKYTLIATDDIVFIGASITRAIVHLENNNGCGAVTFANNHNAPDGKYTCAYHNITSEDGRRIAVPYPQIALVRTWLGKHCDWWGGRTVMRDGWTYAGDNHLGYAIYNAGYTVDVVPGVVNDEIQRDDDVRRGNSERHLNDAKLWQQHYTTHPPKFKQSPVDNPHNKQLRVLYLDGFNPNVPNHAKYKKAFLGGLQDAGLVYFYDYKRDEFSAPAHIARIADAWQPHLIFSNIHGGFSAEQITRIRQHTPNAVWCNWIGDVWDTIHFDQLPLWRSMDILFTCNADYIDRLRSEGINAHHLLGGYEAVNMDALPDMPAHDVLWQANQRNGQRTQMIDVLQSAKRDGHDVGVYAFDGYDTLRTGDTWYNWNEIRALNANATLAISDNEFNASGYTSNRIWEILIAGGALCLHQETPDFKHYTGLKDGVHYVAWRDLDDLREKIIYWLAPENQKRRRQIVRNAQRQAEKHHSFAHRVQHAIEVISNCANADNEDERWKEIYDG